jgi:hypothetical protein
MTVHALFQRSYTIFKILNAGSAEICIQQGTCLYIFTETYHRRTPRILLLQLQGTSSEIF